MAYWLKKEIDIRFVSAEKARPNWAILKQLDYGIGRPGSSNRIIAPKGFVTDGASTPQILWWLFPPVASYLPAAVIHDLLYRTGGDIGKYKEAVYAYKEAGVKIPDKFTRKECDLIFKEAMYALKGSDYEVPGWKIKMMYRAVRTFGFLSFKG